MAAIGHHSMPLKMNVLRMDNIQVTSKQNPSLAAPRLGSEWKFQKSCENDFVNGTVNRFGIV